MFTLNGTSTKAITQAMMKATIVLALTAGFSANNFAQEAAPDKSREIDVVYSKLVSALPNEGVLMTSPYADSLGTFGDDAKAKFNKQSDAIGGVSLEIETRNGKNPWDAGVFNKLGVAIKKGDVIYMAFFAKALELPKGQTTTVVKNSGVQQDGEPYATVIGKDITLNDQWQSFAIAGVAADDYDAQQTQAFFQVATGKQTLAFGPVFVFNLGPGVDPTSLPFITR